MKNKLSLILLFTAVFYFSLQPASDPDTGWHIATGRYIVTNHQIPQTDPFSYSLPNHPYIAHSWLSDTISYILVEQFGIISLSVVYALLTALSLFFIAKISQNLSSHPSLPFLVPLISYPAIEIIGQRPQAFSVLGISILMYLLTKKEKSSQFIWQIFVLFIIWTNLHGGVLLGLAIFLLWWLQAIFLKSSPKHLSTLSLALGVSFITTLLNPYTYKIFIFTWGMITNQISFTYNADWVPLFSSLHGSSSLLLRLLIVVVSAVSIIDNPKHKYLRYISLLLLLLSLWSIRFLVPLLVVVSPLILQTFSKALSSVDHYQFFPLLPTLLIGILLFNPLVNKRDLLCSIKDECYANISQMPYSAVKYLKVNNINGNIFDFYTWGGYLSWQLPDSKVFIDGRMDNFFVSGESFLSEFVYIHQMKEDWYEKLISYHTDLVLIPTSWTQHQQSLENLGWQTITKDDLSILMKKTPQ
jgi:hypothetical protein